MRGILGPHHNEHDAERVEQKHERPKFAVGLYGRDLDAPRRGLLAAWRARAPASLKTLYLSAHSKVAILGANSPDARRLVSMLTTLGECRVEHVHRLADFKRPLRHYHYCVFGSELSAADVGTCAHALSVEKLTTQLLATLEGDEFLIWPSPRGVLRFRLCPPGDEATRS